MNNSRHGWTAPGSQGVFVRRRRSRLERSCTQPLETSERVGAGRFDTIEHLYAEKDIRELLAVPFDALVEQCRRTTPRPNMEEFGYVDVARDGKAIYVWTIYKLRNGRKVYHKRYFSKLLELIHGAG